MLEEIGKLEGEVIERVIDEENARTFDKFGVEVLLLDGVKDSQGDRFNSDGEFRFENPVAVIREFDKHEIIGWATLYRGGKSLLADLFIRYDCPERLAIEAGVRLYPKVGGTVQGVTCDEDLQGRTVTKAEIKAICLNIDRNADERIGPV